MTSACLVPMLQVEQGEVFAVVCDHLGMPKELLGQDGRVAWAAAHSLRSYVWHSAARRGEPRAGVRRGPEHRPSTLDRVPGRQARGPEWIGDRPDDIATRLCARA